MVTARDFALFVRSAAKDAVRLYFDPVTRLARYRDKSRVSTPESRPDARAQGRVRVFVSHSHDKAQYRFAIEHWLRTSMNAETLSVRDHAARGQTILEAVEETIKRSDYAIFFLSGAGFSAGVTSRHIARDNLFFELGIALAALGRKRVSVIAESDFTSGSAFEGLRWIPGNTDLSEIESELRESLREVEAAN